MLPIDSIGISALRKVSYDMLKFDTNALNDGAEMLQQVHYLHDDLKGNLTAKCMSAVSSGDSYNLTYHVITFL